MSWPSRKSRNALIIVQTHLVNGLNRLNSNGLIINLVVTNLQYYVKKMYTVTQWFEFFFVFNNFLIKNYLYIY